LLDDEETMRRLWGLILPGVPWNRRRWQAFTKRRIVCDRSKLPDRSYEKLQQFLGAEVETLVLPPL